ncbi:hypothetical protein [Agrobacterium salinitolerans]|uniref:hypothetical protein n=1 Tax=Agrobacterium salinitolerans TaxID=1183413 RepID=UPI0022C14B11|nr:hypothetical protein [Agrobacterium salinitolerans]
MWHDKFGLTVTAQNIGEERFALIALLGEKLWLAVHTVRAIQCGVAVFASFPCDVSEN